MRNEKALQTSYISDGTFSINVEAVEKTQYKCPLLSIELISSHDTLMFQLVAKKKPSHTMSTSLNVRVDWHGVISYRSVFEVFNGVSELD